MSDDRLLSTPFGLALLALLAVAGLVIWSMI
jgi:hypothetical protein